MKLLTLVLIGSFWVIGCGTREVVVGTALPCPDPLVLVKADPTVRAHIDAMKNAVPGSDQRMAYEFFLHRSAKQKARRVRLQEICRSTH